MKALAKYLADQIDVADNRLAAQVIMESGQMYVGAVSHVDGCSKGEVFQILTPVQTHPQQPPNMLTVVFDGGCVAAVMPVDEQLIKGREAQQGNQSGIVLDGN